MRHKRIAVKPVLDPKSTKYPDRTFYGGAWRTPEQIERIQAHNRSERKRVIQRQKRYGVSPEVYDQMLSDQGGVCVLCQKECPTGESLSVDHNHVTGVVRGLLCRRCNSAVAMEDENPGWLLRAMEYLA